jgi:hypothetical protein
MKEIIDRHRNRSSLAENFNTMPLDRPKAMPHSLKRDWR